MLFTNSYKRIERGIIAFVSVIGLSFLYELFLVDIDWSLAARSWVVPDIPQGSMLIIMSVLGAVVMPHNLFLHSEVVQSREYNKQDDASIRKLLKYEFYDTLFSMGVGWAINSAMILLAAATFFVHRTPVEELQQAKSLLDPLLGSQAGVIFALALLMAGISSTVTSGMAAGSIFARHVQRVIPHQRYPLTGRCLAVIGCGTGAYPFHRKPLSGSDYLADDVKHPASVYRVSASGAYFLAPRDGTIRQLALEFIRTLRHRYHCIRAEHHVAVQLTDGCFWIFLK